MKIVIFDGWLETLGGGERQTLAAAEALTALGEVTVVSHLPVVRARAAERSGLSLGDVRFAVEAERAGTDGRSLELGADVFINATHHSRYVASAVASIRFVYFPPRPAARLERLAGQVMRLVGEGLGAAAELDGWYGPEGGGRHWYRQSGGRGRLRVRPGSTLRLWLGDMRPRRERDDGGYKIRASDGTLLAEGLAAPGGDFAPSGWFRVPGSCDWVMVESPAVEVAGGLERRLIGLALGSIEERAPLQGAWQRLSRRVLPRPARWEAEQGLADYARIYRSYRVVSPNSHYTGAWLRRWWGIEGEVIHPPVMCDENVSAVRSPLILSIGRFFTGGHNKKHLVMVQAFRRIVESGLRGWRLALVGGVGARAEDRRYLEEVRAAARGLPVDLYPDAEESRLRELRQRASICWHAAGHGEPLERFPERYEHFGIAVAEMMGSGVVPVVIDGGGMREIVEHGRSGFRWRTLDELTALTLRLIRDADLRRRMRLAGRARARRWSLAEYQRRVVALVQRVHAESSEPGSGGC